jgi:hypothetical protein
MSLDEAVKGLAALFGGKTGRRFPIYRQYVLVQHNGEWEFRRDEVDAAIEAAIEKHIGRATKK